MDAAGGGGGGDAAHKGVVSTTEEAKPSYLNDSARERPVLLHPGRGWAGRGRDREGSRTGGRGRTPGTGTSPAGFSLNVGVGEFSNGVFIAVPGSPGPGASFQERGRQDNSHAAAHVEDRRRHGYSRPAGLGPDSSRHSDQYGQEGTSGSGVLPSPDVARGIKGFPSTRIRNREYESDFRGGGEARQMPDSGGRGGGSSAYPGRSSGDYNSNAGEGSGGANQQQPQGVHESGTGQFTGRIREAGGGPGRGRALGRARGRGRGNVGNWQEVHHAPNVDHETQGSEAQDQNMGARQVSRQDARGSGGRSTSVVSRTSTAVRPWRGFSRGGQSGPTGGGGWTGGHLAGRAYGGRGISAQWESVRGRGAGRGGRSESRGIQGQYWRQGVEDLERSGPKALGLGDSLPQLVQEIGDKLTQGRVECMICYDLVWRTAPTWSCGSCYAIFHLHCIRKWARAPTSADTSQGRVNQHSEDSWRCPGCQTAQHMRANEIRYMCFCGKREDPARDDYLLPHSCGETCGRQLDKSGEGMCPHHCTLQCHPGPCPPCTAPGVAQKCHCGKQEFIGRCAEQSKEGLSCGELCARALLCGRHLCDKVCHAGYCGTCEVLIPAKCYCGKKEEAMRCGHVEPEGARDVGGSGEFSCRQVCRKTLVCENHKCTKPCHSDPCGECQLLPSKVATCPCGKELLTQIMPGGKERLSCLDAVPTCGQTCSKLLPCGKHRCLADCHGGPCSKCVVEVAQACRCGDSSRLVPCFKTLGVAPDSGPAPEPNLFPVTSGEPEAFICDKKCGKKKNCGKHRCSNKCCPVGRDGFSGNLSTADDPHLCMLVCGKKLQCGQHSCAELCHAGHCPPCLNSEFTELSCACGATVVPPPVPCGTPLPACPQLCSVRQPCGHPPTHLCHLGECPPCTHPIAKGCVGGHVVLRGVPCGSKDIKCNNECGRLRACGQHFCSRACHLPPCDLAERESGPGRAVEGPGVRSCRQPCGAQRRDCQHTCAAACHPGGPCPDTRCQAPVSISCGCGRITAEVPCGCGGGKEPDSPMVLASLPFPLQPLEEGTRAPLGQRKLSCDEECAKLEKRRLLAEAFQPFDGSADPVLAAGSDALAEASRKEPQWLAGAEGRLQALVLGSSRTGASKEGVRVHVFRPMPPNKREALHLLAERWALGSTSTGREPRRMVVVYTTHKSRAPPKLVSSKTLVPSPGLAPYPKLNQDLDLDPACVVALFDLPREANVSTQLLRFGGECELVWLNDKNALAIFEEPARAATALRYLDHALSYWGANARHVVPAGSAAKGSVWGARGALPGAKTTVKTGAKQGWAEDAWGDEEGSSAHHVSKVGAWHRKGGPPIAPTGNAYGALESSSKGLVEGSDRCSGSGSGTSRRSNFTVLGSTTSAFGVGSAASLGAGKTSGTSSGQEGDGEPEDWEKMLDD